MKRWEEVSQLLVPKTKIVEVGQPHLWAQTEKLIEKRREKRVSEKRHRYFFLSQFLRILVQINVVLTNLKFLKIW